VTLSRAHFTCRRCGANAHPLDQRLGVDGLVSPHAQRLLCVAGAERSFERAAQHLPRELAGLCACDNTVRAACDRHGGRMRAWQRDDPEASRPFREASGDVEFEIDGTCVDTTGGWREVRLSIFARRRGEPVTDLDAWDDQRLPAPHARVATAVIRSSQALGPQWRRAASRLGIKRTAELTMLGDRAQWIWAEVEKNLPGAAGVLDVYHAGEHLHAAAIALRSEASAAEAWYEARRRTLLESGPAGLLAALATEAADVSELVGYLGPHVDHTPYRQRLAEGRSIGSGMVEGACKTAIGLRLKQTGARWRVKRLERMAALCCLHYSDQFDAYWKKAAG
jgi:hypothetical protein